MKNILILLLLFASNFSLAQSVYKIGADKLLIGTDSANDTVVDLGGVQVKKNKATGKIQLSNDGATFSNVVDEATLTAALASVSVPVGSSIMWHASTCPALYFPMDGSAKSRVTYSELFAAIGITHGQGDGSTTFNIPDFRGRFPRMIDGTAGNDPDKASRTAMAVGGNVGNNIGSVQDSDNKQHTHIQNAHGHSAYGSSEAGAGTNLGKTGSIGFLGVSSGTGNGYYSTAPSGGHYLIQQVVAINQNSGGTESRPKNGYVNFCIRYQAF